MSDCWKSFRLIPIPNNAGVVTNFNIAINVCDTFPKFWQVCIFCCNTDVGAIAKKVLVCRTSPVEAKETEVKKYPRPRCVLKSNISFLLDGRLAAGGRRKRWDIEHSHRNTIWSRPLARKYYRWIWLKVWIEEKLWFDNNPWLWMQNYPIMRWCAEPSCTTPKFSSICICICIPSSSCISLSVFMYFHPPHYFAFPLTDTVGNVLKVINCRKLT